MFGPLAKALSFLLEHADVLEAVWEAVEGGTTKEELVAAIKKSMVKAADDEIRAEFPVDEP